MCLVFLLPVCLLPRKTGIGCMIPADQGDRSSNLGKTQGVMHPCGHCLGDGGSATMCVPDSCSTAVVSLPPPVCPVCRWYFPPVAIWAVTFPIPLSIFCAGAAACKCSLTSIIWEILNVWGVSYEETTVVAGRIQTDGRAYGIEHWQREFKTGPLIRPPRTLCPDLSKLRACLAPQFWYPSSSMLNTILPNGFSTWAQTQAWGTGNPCPRCPCPSRSRAAPAGRIFHLGAPEPVASSFSAGFRFGGGSFLVNKMTSLGTTDFSTTNTSENIIQFMCNVSLRLH